MIDQNLEQRLALLVGGAPEPPPIDLVRARVRQRRRRRGAVIAAACVVVVALGVSTLVVVHGNGSRNARPRVATNPGAIVPATDSIHVTAPNGTEFTITGAPGLGLEHLPVRFFAQIRSVTLEPQFTAQQIVVQDVSAPTPGTCWFGYTYGRWRLLLRCGSDAEHERIHELLDGHVNADGYLVFNPAGLLILGPTDAPDVELGDDAIGIFGPETFPTGCPSADQVTAHTAAGLPARVDATGAAWCDPEQDVRVHVSEKGLASSALQSLEVQVRSTVVTSLYGTTFEVKAPGIVLGRPIFQAGVATDDPPFPGSPVVETSHETLPARAAGAASYSGPDGVEFYAAQSDLGQDVLAGTVDGWSVVVTADGLSAHERALLAAGLRFRERDGFLVLLPVAPFHLASPGGTEIILGGVWIEVGGYPNGCPTEAEATEHTAAGYPVRLAADLAIWCDPVGRVEVEVRSADQAAAIKGLQITRVG